MENIFFSKTIADNYNNQFLTIGDFVKICDVIKVGVFEVMIENCASHSRYFSDELDAQNFYQNGNKCLSYSYAYGILFL